MKKTIFKIGFILLIFIIASVVLFKNNEDDDLLDIKVADTTLTSRTYMN